MSIECSSASITNLSLSDIDSKPAIELLNGVKIFSLSFVTQAGGFATLPNHSLYIDSNGVFGVVEGGIYRPFLLA